MKKILISLIDIYKNFFSIAFKSIIGAPYTCRFQESCSDYAKRMIEEKGATKGFFLSLLRISRCQPFYSQNI